MHATADRLPRAPFDPNITRTVVTPPGKHDHLPGVKVIAPYFALVDPATLPRGANWHIRQENELVKLAREERVECIDDHGFLRFEPLKLAAQLAELGIRQTRPFGPELLPPEPIKRTGPTIEEKIRAAMPRMTPEERARMIGDTPGITAGPDGLPLRAIPGDRPYIGTGSYQVDPATAPSFRDE
jgi:hypothetical protein